ncbi:MAG TPA: hypothetical protein DD398_06985 [Lactobacillus johnsonii]|nr:hypothetical protein [Lactobacillus johnsonii]
MTQIVSYQAYLQLSIKKRAKMPSSKKGTTVPTEMQFTPIVFLLMCTTNSPFFFYQRSFVMMITETFGF